MKKIKSLLLIFTLILAFSCFALPVSAYTIANAQYYGIVTVTNNSTSATSDVSANFSANTTAMIAMGLLNSTATNCAIIDSAGNYVPVMPGYLNNPWIAYVGNLNANQTVAYTLYTGNNTSGSLAVFADSTNVTKTAAMEPSSNFTIEYEFFNTTTTNNITIKDAAIKTFNNGSGNITSAIAISDTSATDNNTNTGAWADPTQAYDDNILTPATDTALPGGSTGYLQLNTKSFADYNVSIRFYANRDATLQVQVNYATGGWTNVFNGTYYTGAPTWFAYATNISNPISGIRVNLTDTSGMGTNAYWYDWGVDSTTYVYTLSNTVSQTVATGKRTLTLQEDGANFWQTVDGLSTANITAVAIPNNSNNWTIGSAGIPYWYTWKEWVGGNLKCSLAWNYGATLTDLSGNGNTATPTFRTTCSSTNVSAVLSSFGPVNQALASSSLAIGNLPWNAAPTKPSNFTSPTGTIKVPIIGTFFNDILKTTENQKLFWYIMSFVVIWFGGFLAMRYTHSIVVKTITMGALILGGALSNVYGAWTLIAFGCYAFGILVMSRHYGF